MSTNSGIKYQYALNSEGNLAFISEVEKNTQEKFSCLGCGQKLVPKIGKEIRQRHFAHVDSTNCSNETFLHNLTKITLCNEYNLCLENKIPFFIFVPSVRNCKTFLPQPTILNQISVKLESKELSPINLNNKYSIDCPNVQFNKKIDLTHYFPQKAKLEHPDGNFRPDVFLVNKKGEKLYFELFVTSEVKDKKIKESGAKIIEIDARNKNVLSMIKSHELGEGIAWVQYHNFQIKTRNELCEDCDKYVYKCNQTNNNSPIIISKDDKFTIAEFIQNGSDNKYIHKEILTKSINRTYKKIHDSYNNILKDLYDQIDNFLD